MKNKRGQLNSIPGVAITLLITAVLFVLAIVALSAFQDTTTTSNSVVNESFTFPADEGSVTLAHYRVTAVSEVLNSTDARYTAANYTLSNPTATSSLITFHENATVCKTGATCRVTYLYDTYDTASPVAIQNTIVALGEIPNNWLLIIVIIIAIGAVITIVVGAFKGVNTGGSGR